MRCWERPVVARVSPVTARRAFLPSSGGRLRQSRLARPGLGCPVCAKALSTNAIISAALGWAKNSLASTGTREKLSRIRAIWRGADPRKPGIKVMSKCQT